MRSRVAWMAATVLVIVAAVAWFALRERPSPDAARPGPGAVTAVPDGTAVVGYFAGWGVYARNYHVRDIERTGAAARLSHLVYAFGSTKGGRCGTSDADADHQRPVPAQQSVDGVADTPDQPLRGSFNQLRKLKELHPGLRVLWSFGGWDGSAGFTDAAEDPAAFAASCRRLVDDPRWAGLFDGIDVDWEYPNACGKSCDESGPDAFGRVVAALREEFGPDRLVTAAITADGTDDGRLGRTDYADAATHLNWLMAMTYDYAGTDAPRGPTAPHSALSSYPGAVRPKAVAEAAVDALTAAGVPSRKILLGVGFYGRGWAGVSQARPGGTATGPAAGSYESGIEDYSVLAVTCPPTGTVGGTAYAHCGDRWWSYDTPDTIRAKMRYARSRDLGGAFAWELSGDTDRGDLITAVHTGLTA
jgi:chitinase